MIIHFAWLCGELRCRFPRCYPASEFSGLVDKPLSNSPIIVGKVRIELTCDQLSFLLLIRQGEYIPIMQFLMTIIVRQEHLSKFFMKLSVYDTFIENLLWVGYWIRISGCDFADRQLNHLLNPTNYQHVKEQKNPKLAIPGFWFTKTFKFIS